LAVSDIIVNSQQKLVWTCSVGAAQYPSMCESRKATIPYFWPFLGVDVEDPRKKIGQLKNITFSFLLHIATNCCIFLLVIFS
jgi:hypothetical protein